MHLLTCVHKQSTTISPWMQTEAPKLQGRSREHSPGRRVALWLQRRSPRSGPRSAELPFTHMFPPGMRTQTLASPRPPPPGRRVAPMTADLPLGCRFASGLQIRPWAADLPQWQQIFLLRCRVAPPCPTCFLKGCTLAFWAPNPPHHHTACYNE